jgi:metal-sulfur cluster biosynthetic enzyme
MEGLNTDKAPSVGVVLPHFLLAAIFFLLISILFVVASDSLLDGFFNPRLLALTHLTVLGWASMIIFGVLYQLIPILFETSLYSERLARINLWVFVIAVLAMSYSFWNGQFANSLFHSSILVFISLILFVFNNLMSIRKHKKKNFSSAFIVTSFAWLAMTAVLGISTAINFTKPFLPGNHLVYLKIHAFMGFIGWFLQLVMGVATTLIPMFLVAHNLKQQKLKRAFYLLNASMLLLVCNWLFLNHTLILFFGWLMITLAVFFYLSFIRESFRKKLRKLDIGMQHTAIAFVIILVPIVVALLVILSKAFPNWQFESGGVLYGFTILFAFISTLILGQTFKTLPFIVWLKKYQQFVGKQKVPMPRELYSERIAKWQLYTWVLCLLFVICGLLFSHQVLLKTGAMFMVITALLYSFNVFKIFFHSNASISPIPDKGEIMEQNLMDILRTVMDPEVELNIVDLGLIYNLSFMNDSQVDIEMTFSTRACPLGDAIVMNVIEAITAQHPNLEVNVNITFDPPWTPDKISEAGKKILASQ